MISSFERDLNVAATGLVAPAVPKGDEVVHGLSRRCARIPEADLIWLSRQRNQVDTSDLSGLFLPSCQLSFFYPCQIAGILTAEDPKMELEPGTCSCGVDVGSTTSEGTLSFFNQRRRKEIHRVPWQGDMSDPEHPATSRYSGSSYDFVSTAALMPAKEGPGYQLYAGRQSLSEDENFPIKTLLLWAAGIQRKDALQKAPCGPEILKAVEDGKINKTMILLVFIDHLRLLYRLACARAKALGVTIVHISMTHPNFLCDGEEPGDFRRWRELVLWTMRQVCGMSIRISTISEGQAVASTCPLFPSLLQ